jgi:hypothetical protein
MKISKSKRVASRVYGLILPCKWENHMKIVHHAKTIAKYYYWIKHDRDFYGDAPEDAENPHEPGEVKDPHIHLLFKFNSSRNLETVQNYFKDFEELKGNSFEVIRNAYGSERYLVHADNPEKAQYNIEEVETNDKLFKNVFVEKIASFDELNKLVESYNPTLAPPLLWKDYCDKFSASLVNLNSYQKMCVLDHLRREWRFLVALVEEHRKSKGSDCYDGCPY